MLRVLTRTTIGVLIAKALDLERVAYYLHWERPDWTKRKTEPAYCNCTTIAHAPECPRRKQ